MGSEMCIRDRDCLSHYNFRIPLRDTQGPDTTSPFANSVCQVNNAKFPPASQCRQSDIWCQSSPAACRPPGSYPGSREEAHRLGSAISYLCHGASFSTCLRLPHELPAPPYAKRTCCAG